MPSARSASWPNQGLSGTARHFPGLGILSQMPNSAFSPYLRGTAYPPVANARRGHRPDDVVAIDLRGPRNDHQHLLVSLGRAGTVALAAATFESFLTRQEVADA